MARSAADLALFFAAMVRFDRRDPSSRPVSWEDFVDPAPADLSQLKVAFSEDLGFAPVDRTIRKVFRDRKDAIAKRFHAAEDRDPNLGDAMRIFETLRGVSFLASLLEDYRRHPDLIGPNVRANVELGLGLTAEQIGWAMAEHAKLYRRFVGFMEEVDLLIAPVAAVTPFEKPQSHPTEINGEPLETYVSWIALTFGLTLTCHPVLCMPCGLDHKGMPFGIQLVGRRQGEAKLLSIARALESELGRETSTERPLPDLERLQKLSAESMG
jgi:Asp-tRNA(Asn)/Glu-tRNA(Gln) amidotransferase A subunit family amidase